MCKSSDSNVSYYHPLNVCHNPAWSMGNEPLKTRNGTKASVLALGMQRGANRFARAGDFWPWWHQACSRSIICTHYGCRTLRGGAGGAAEERGVFRTHNSRATVALVKRPSHLFSDYILVLCKPPWKRGMASHSISLFSINQLPVG